MFYYFDVSYDHGAPSSDETGSEFDSIDEAREQAIVLAAELVLERQPKTDDMSVAVMVRCGRDRVRYEVSSIINGFWTEREAGIVRGEVREPDRDGG